MKHLLATPLAALSLGVLTLGLPMLQGAAHAQAPAPAVSANGKIQFITLGTGGGPVVKLKRGQPANAVVINGAFYLFDVGDGVMRTMRSSGLILKDLRAIFISHHHIDHNASLGPLMATRWVLSVYKPFEVIGPPGTVKMVDNLTEAYRPVELAPVSIGGPPKPKIAATVKVKDMVADVTKPDLVYQDENIKVTAINNDHYHYEPGSLSATFSRSYAFRIEGGGQSYVYTGDTGPSQGVELLAKDADVLITEVINMPAMEAELKRNPNVPESARKGVLSHLEHNHVTPLEIGKMAARANVKKVVLTHLVPGEDNESDPAIYTDGISENFKGPVVVANDGDTF